MDIRTFIIQFQSLTILEVGVGADLGFMFAEGVLIALRFSSGIVIKIFKISSLVKNR